MCRVGFVLLSAAAQAPECARAEARAKRSLVCVRFRMVTGLCRDGDMSGNEFEDEADDAEGFVAAETFDGPRVGTSHTLPRHHK